MTVTAKEEYITSSTRTDIYIDWSGSATAIFRVRLNAMFSGTVRRTRSFTVDFIL